MSIMYHVFDWEQDHDEYFEDYTKAEKYFYELKKQGCTRLRIYEIEEDPEGCFSEECIEYYEWPDEYHLNT